MEKKKNCVCGAPLVEERWGFYGEDWQDRIFLRFYCQSCSREYDFHGNLKK